jgi:hypothetical protein
LLTQAARRISATRALDGKPLNQLVRYQGGLIFMAVGMLLTRLIAMGVRAKGFL